MQIKLIFVRLYMVFKDELWENMINRLLCMYNMNYKWNFNGAYKTIAHIRSNDLTYMTLKIHAQLQEYAIPPLRTVMMIMTICMFLKLWHKWHSKFMSNYKNMQFLFLELQWWLWQYVCNTSVKLVIIMLGSKGCKGQSQSE